MSFKLTVACNWQVKYSTCQIVLICHPQRSLLAETRPLNTLRHVAVIVPHKHIWPGKEVKYYFECNRWFYSCSWKTFSPRCMDIFLTADSRIRFIYIPAPVFFILYLFRTMICQVDTYWHLLSFSSFSNLLVKVKLWAKHRWVKWSIDCIDCWLDITVQQYPGNDDKWSRTRTTTSYHLLVSSPLLSMFDHKNKSVMKQLLTFFSFFLIEFVVNPGQ